MHGWKKEQLIRRNGPNKSDGDKMADPVNKAMMDDSWLDPQYLFLRLTVELHNFLHSIASIDNNVRVCR